jgi:RNA polymerase sigma-70 factor (ECF subfamily)
MSEDPHSKLMLRFQSGDESAFRELYEEYKPALINFIYRFYQDKRIAEELSHEVFIRVYKAASSYRPEAKFSTWLYRITINLCLNELRANKHQYESESFSLQESNNGNSPFAFADTSQAKADERIEARERQKDVRQAIAQLPKKQRLALLLSVYYQLPYKEIGYRIGCSEGAVKSMIHRDKIEIKERLTK